MALEVSGDALWVFLQENEIIVPEDWKIVLSAMKYDSLTLLAKLDQSDMDEIRRFMRIEYHKLIDEDEVKKTYGVYSRKPENFELTGGQKKSIKSIIVGCNSLLAQLKRKRCTTSEKDPTKILKKSGPAEKRPSPSVNSTKEDKITADLKNNLESNIEGYLSVNVPDICDANGKISVTANIKRIGDSNYMAEVQCPAEIRCSKSASKKKPCWYVGMIHRNSHKNWNTSNFYKHCKTHVKCAGQKSVKSYFATSNNSKEGSEERDQEEINLSSRKRIQRIVDSDEELEDNVEEHDLTNPDNDSENGEISGKSPDEDFYEETVTKKKS